MRLIDAGELIKNLSDYALQESPTGFESDADKTLQRTIYETIKSCIEAVETQPTAYDSDKVVAQLEKEKNRIYRLDGSLLSERQNIKIDKAIGIVKGGGIDG